jgi:hypothetical protein
VPVGPSSQVMPRASGAREEAGSSVSSSSVASDRGGTSRRSSALARRPPAGPISARVPTGAPASAKLPSWLPASLLASVSGVGAASKRGDTAASSAAVASSDTLASEGVGLAGPCITVVPGASSEQPSNTTSNATFKLFKAHLGARALSARAQVRPRVVFFPPNSFRSSQPSARQVACQRPPHQGRALALRCDFPRATRAGRDPAPDAACQRASALSSYASHRAAGSRYTATAPRSACSS